MDLEATQYLLEGTHKTPKGGAALENNRPCYSNRKCNIGRDGIFMSRLWRTKTTKYLATRAITAEELPILIEAMREDGVTAVITPNGVKWFHGSYSVTKAAVADVWGLTDHQIGRVIKYIYGNDPF